MNIDKTLKILKEFLQNCPDGLSNMGGTNHMTLTMSKKGNIKFNLNFQPAGRVQIKGSTLHEVFEKLIPSLKQNLLINNQENEKSDWYKQNRPTYKIKELINLLELDDKDDEILFNCSAYTEENRIEDMRMYNAFHPKCSCSEENKLESKLKQKELIDYYASKGICYLPKHPLVESLFSKLNDIKSCQSKTADSAEQIKEQIEEYDKWIAAQSDPELMKQYEV